MKPSNIFWPEELVDSEYCCFWYFGDILGKKECLSCDGNKQTTVKSRWVGSPRQNAFTSKPGVTSTAEVSRRLVTGTPAPPVGTGNWGTTSCFQAAFRTRFQLHRLTLLTWGLLAHRQLTGTARTLKLRRSRALHKLTPSPTVLLTCSEILIKICTSSFSQALLFQPARGTHSRRQLLESQLCVKP